MDVLQPGITSKVNASSNTVSNVNLSHTPLTLSTMPVISNDVSNDSKLRRNVFDLCSTSATIESPLKHGGNVLVIGGSSFIGAKVSLYFHNQGLNVIPVEDQEKFIDKRMALYRWQKLHDYKLDTKLVDTGNLESFLHSHNVDEIIYIPTHLFDGQKKNDDNIAFKGLNLSGILKNFVRLLELIYKKYPLVRLSLISLPLQSTLSFQSAWLKTFEVSLTAYQQLYGLNAAIIRFDGVYGPWQNEEEDNNWNNCWYMNDIVDIIVKTLKNKFSCREVDLHPCQSSSNMSKDPAQLKTIALTKQWLANYSTSLQKQENYVMSTYFTSVKNPQYSFTFLKNGYRFVQRWFESAMKIGAHAVIFHDGLTEDLQNRMRNLYNRVDFHKVDVGLKGRSPNDYRFYLYNEYLWSHPEIENVVLTDMRDIKFLNDPFEVMRLIGDYVYMGIDVTFYENSWSHGWLHGVLRSCHSKDSESMWVKLHPFYNAGVMGGTRPTMLKFLKKMTQYLDGTPHHHNCNMGTITLVTHKHFYEQSFSGYPFQSAFKLGITGPQGVAVKHKVEQKNDSF